MNPEITQFDIIQSNSKLLQLKKKNKHYYVNLCNNKLYYDCKHLIM